MISQEKLSAVRNTKKDKFRVARSSSELGSPKIYRYESRIIKKLSEEFNKKIPLFDIEYQPNPFEYQYDLELFIFFNYEELKAQELQLCDSKDESFINEYGATGFDRQEHLLNAMSIRWPTRMLSNGAHSGLLVRNPWLEDYSFAVSNYQNTVVFGGAGQGKTYGFLSLMCMAFDFFYYTKSGAQCSYSTTSEFKLKLSTWAYVNKLYGISDNRRPFSISAGKGRKGAHYTFNRWGLNNKIIDEGGKFNGVILTKGAQDARVIDKLTGCHDPVCRIYLLDEAQTTDGAPLDAYGNMFLHPKYKFFGMSGNYQEETDLLGINAEPNTGWDSVNEKTHMWEGTLKTISESPKGKSLGKTTCVIHYNNDLSPAITEPKNAIKYPFLPNQQKKEELYNTEELKNSYAYKRFWVGFRFEGGEQKVAGQEPVMTMAMIKEFGADGEPNWEGEPIRIGSFDSAPSGKDRNLYLTSEVGLSSDDGYPLLNFRKLTQFKKTESAKEYYKITTKEVQNIISLWDIKRMIIDWSSRTSMLEFLSEVGIVTDYIIYHAKMPKEDGAVNTVGDMEDRVDLESIKSFVNGIEKQVTTYADQKISKRFACGAYILRLLIEKGRVRGLNKSLLANVEHNGFEKELCRRYFVKEGRTGLLNINDKDDFIEKYGFSTDIFDVLVQTAYLFYVILKIRPSKKTLGLLGLKKVKKNVDNFRKLWHVRPGNF